MRPLFKKIAVICAIGALLQLSITTYAETVVYPVIDIRTQQTYTKKPQIVKANFRHHDTHELIGTRYFLTKSTNSQTIVQIAKSYLTLGVSFIDGYADKNIENTDSTTYATTMGEIEAGMTEVNYYVTSLNMVPTGTGEENGVLNITALDEIPYVAELNALVTYTFKDIYTGDVVDTYYYVQNGEVDGITMAVEKFLEAQSEYRVSENNAYREGKIDPYNLHKVQTTIGEIEVFDVHIIVPVKPKGTNSQIISNEVTTSSVITEANSNSETNSSEEQNASIIKESNRSSETNASKENLSNIVPVADNQEKSSEVKPSSDSALGNSDKTSKVESSEQSTLNADGTTTSSNSNDTIQSEKDEQSNEQKQVTSAVEESKPTEASSTVKKEIKPTLKPQLPTTGELGLSLPIIGAILVVCSITLVVFVKRNKE